MSYVAQTERDFNRQRQAEGIAAAKTRGVRFGRKPLLMPDAFAELAEEWWRGRVSAAQAGRELGISRTTFKLRAEEWCVAVGLGKRAAKVWPSVCLKPVKCLLEAPFYQDCADFMMEKGRRRSAAGRRSFLLLFDLCQYNGMNRLH